MSSVIHLVPKIETATLVAWLVVVLFPVIIILAFDVYHRQTRPRLPGGSSDLEPPHS